MNKDKKEFLENKEKYPELYLDTIKDGIVLKEDCYDILNISINCCHHIWNLSEGHEIDEINFITSGNNSVFFQRKEVCGKNCFFVCFKSASTILEWFRCFSFFKKPCKYLKFKKVHGGILKRFLELEEEFLEVFEQHYVKGDKIVVFGHSLGGPLSLFAHLSLLEKGYEDINNFSFNSPFFLTKEAKKELGKIINEYEFNRFFRANDLISNFPKFGDKKSLLNRFFRRLFNFIKRLLKFKYFGRKIKIREDKTGSSIESHRKLITREDFLEKNFKVQNISKFVKKTEAQKLAMSF
ncbi:MAG: hypothetical protein LBJ09_03770 [Clostridiales bacterium]|nr:hypothetical protein [Clostridiales bacterium]